MATDADFNSRVDQACRVAEIQSGFAAIDNNVAGVPCVPIAMLEAWLLADLASSSNLGATDLIELPRKRFVEGLLTRTGID